MVFCFCRNDEILSFRNLSEKTETAPPSFPRRRESGSVGAETYRVKRFLRS
ncbi:pilS cassette [Neisseria gonorrhoeae]